MDIFLTDGSVTYGPSYLNCNKAGNSYSVNLNHLMSAAYRADKSRTDKEIVYVLEYDVIDASTTAAGTTTGGGGTTTTTDESSTSTLSTSAENKLALQVISKVKETCGM